VVVRLVDLPLVVAAVTLSFCVAAPSASAQRTVRPTRILLLFQQQAEAQPMQEFTQRLRWTSTDSSGASPRHLSSNTSTTNIVDSG
jgi:hypothetical protein